ncbi:nucleoside:proton symporter [Desulfuromonas versatilis]|uniref:Nucleoside:proton symporter n=1 Tax=Desulfuromonas versatilis TaxID=2802975 RepID=A0ABM8HP32_9BACT|nr:nucleoside transporter C-terminal domain-containing protein [Desulfuromonas versatilis]BCR03337.1 nucleoside:proton symporter [Desulfuromonas versatilis]
MAYQGVLGIVVLLGLAWLLSEERGQVRWRPVLTGVALQLVLAAALVKLAPFRLFFLGLNEAVMFVDRATQAGTALVFGFLGGGPLPYAETAPGASFTLAFRALPLVLVVSALSALLFYWRVLPLLVRAFSWVLRKTMNIGGALGVGAAANVFVGMVEAPLLVRPYLAEMSRSELFTLMTCGMSTIAGTVLVLYASILQQAVPDALGHILIASVISAPAAIAVAQLMVPQQGAVTGAEIHGMSEASGAMDAVTRGTAEGLKLLLNIIAMLIVLVALVSLVNQLLALLPAAGGRPLTLQGLLGWLMAPVAWLIGIPWQEAVAAGSLLGTKTVLNEFVAYLELAALPETALSPRSRLIMTYALCGFANLGSLGIMIGGLGTMAPGRRGEIVSLGGKSIVAGILATCMTGAVIGLL